jgi:ElaB/YqjD/DUF883 family membrane-anchored ribosome-binding protein
MFGTHLLDRRSKPERIADQAWEYLLSATESAKDTARSAGQRTAHVADATGAVSSVVGSAADEAMRRASAAYDALAGRRPSTPWALIAVAGIVGAAIGWAAGSASRAALARMSDSGDARDTDRIEFVETDRPVSLDN